jgi:hypothetical protein
MNQNRGNLKQNMNGASRNSKSDTGTNLDGKFGLFINPPSIQSARGTGPSVRQRQQPQPQNQQQTMPQMNMGNSGILMFANSAFADRNGQIVKPGDLSQGMDLPIYIQDKIKIWKENKLQKDKSRGSFPPSVHQSQESADQIESQAPLNVQANQYQQIRLLQQPVQQQQQQQQQLFHQQPLQQSSSIQQETVFEESPQSIDELSTKQNVPSIFDSGTQEIMNRQIEFQVNKILDQLKKERPELTNQADVMTIVNQKIRKSEDMIQQMHVRNQRLSESVEQMNVKVKAVQSNVDQVKNQPGGTSLTEETMRSWVQFFLGEQLGLLKTDLNEVMNTKLEYLNTAIKTQEANTNVIDIKLQNTLQDMWESTFFVFGTVLKEVALYKESNKNSEEVRNCSVGEKLLLTYPILKFGDDRWMKVRIVDSLTAEIGQAFVPVLLKSNVYVGNFHIV